jgi:hypothetical protein
LLPPKYENSNRIKEDEPVSPWTMSFTLSFYLLQESIFDSASRQHERTFSRFHWRKESFGVIIQIFKFTLLLDIKVFIPFYLNKKIYS